MRPGRLVAAAFACLVGLSGEARGEPLGPGTILTGVPSRAGRGPFLLGLDPRNNAGQPILIQRLCRQTNRLGLALAPDILRGGDIVVANEFGAYRLSTTGGEATLAFKRLLTADVEAGPDAQVVVGHSDGTLRTIDPATGVQKAFVTLADNLPPHYQFAFAPSGDLYVASRLGLTRYEAGTWTASAVVTPPPGEEFVAWDLAISSSGEIFVTQGFGSESRIVRVDPVSGARTVVSEGGEFLRLLDMTVGPSGQIFVAGDFFHGSRRIVRVDPATGAQSFVTQSRSSRVSHLAFTPGGDFLAATTRGLLRIDPTTGAETVVAPGQYHYLEIVSGSEVLSSTRTRYVRVTLESGAVTDLAPVTPTLGGIAVTADGEILLAHGHLGILRVGPGSRRPKEVAVGGAFVSPVAVALAPNGDVVAVDPAAAEGGAVIRVSPATGTQQVVSDGGAFRNLAGIAVASTGAIFISDQDAPDGSGAVFRVDPATGEQTIVSAGGFLATPAGIAVGASEVLVADPDGFEGRGAIIRVDLASGVQTVLASGERFTSVAVVPGRAPELPTTTTTTITALTTTTITVTTTSLPGGGTLPPPPPEAGAERCDNCADDDGDGLVDYEDPACCGSVGSLKGRWFTSGKGKHRLHLNVVLRAAGMDPRTQPVTVLVRDAKAPLRCDVLASQGWRKERRGFVFPETKDTEGLKVARLRFRAGGSARLRALSRKGVVAGLNGPELMATVHIGGRCATGNLRFAGKKLPAAARRACSGRRPC